MESLSVQFTKMQRAAVVAEVACARGNIPSFNEAIKITMLMAASISTRVAAMLKGETNDEETNKCEDQTSAGRDQATLKQPGSEAKS